MKIFMHELLQGSPAGLHAFARLAAHMQNKLHLSAVLTLCISSDDTCMHAYGTCTRGQADLGVVQCSASASAAAAAAG